MTDLRESIKFVLENYLEFKAGSFNSKNPVARALLNDMPEYIEPFFEDNYKVYGSNGKGRWANVPWVCMMRNDIATTTKEGVYLGYLFSTDMDKVYLTLTTGVTEIEQFFKKRMGQTVLKELTQYGREVIMNEFTNEIKEDYKLDDDIYLGDNTLASWYECGTILYKTYSIDDLPSNEDFENDLKNFIRIYDKYLKHLSNFKSRLIDLVDKVNDSIRFGIQDEVVTHSNDLLLELMTSVLYGRKLDRSGVSSSLELVLQTLVHINTNTYGLSFSNLRLVESYSISNYLEKFIEYFFINPLQWSTRYTKMNAESLRKCIVYLSILLSLDNLEYDISYFSNELRKQEIRIFNFSYLATQWIVEYTVLFKLFSRYLNENELEYFYECLGNYFCYTDILDKSTGQIELESPAIKCLYQFGEPEREAILLAMTPNFKNATHGRTNLELLLKSGFVNELNANGISFSTMLVEDVTAIIVSFMRRYVDKKFIERNSYTSFEVSEEDTVLDTVYDDQVLRVNRYYREVNNRQKLRYEITVGQFYSLELDLIHDNGYISIHPNDKKVSMEMLMETINDEFLAILVMSSDQRDDIFDMDKLEQLINGSVDREFENNHVSDSDISLLYIWVSKYKFLENQNINLSSDYEISFVDNVLKIEELGTPLYVGLEELKPILNNGKLDKLQNMTALVGKNGSGKSTIINLLLSVYERNDDDIEKFVIVYKKDGNIHYDYNFDEEFTHSFTTKNETGENKEIVPQRVSGISSYFSNTSLIKFSNIVDPYSEYQTRKSDVNDDMDNQGQKGIIDISTQSLFNTYAKEQGFEESSVIEYEQLKVIRFLIDYQEIFFERKSLIEDSDRFLSPYIPTPRITIKHNGDILFDPSDIKVHEYDNPEEKSKLIEVLESVYDEYEAQLSEGNNSSLEVIIDGMSAGGFSRLALFSRLHWLCIDKKIGSNETNLTQKVLVVLDEAEAHYHPEWLRSFVFDVVYVLSNSFGIVEDVNSVELILATNSPFLLGDIPLSNAILLSRDVEDKLGEIKQTFGQNIHTLIRNSFFVSELLGEYADFKIASIIKILNSDKLEEKSSITNLKRSIDRIGEPILKQVLLNDFYSVYSDFDDVERLIQLYKERIEALEKRVAN